MLQQLLVLLVCISAWNAAPVDGATDQKDGMPSSSAPCFGLWFSPRALLFPSGEGDERNHSFL